MLHTFIPSNIPINEQDIINFEELIGTDLPQEYRQFILQYNGGEFENSIYKGIDEYLVDPDFYPLVNAIPGEYNLIFEVKNWLLNDHRVDDIISTKHYLKIGQDFLGNVIYISINENSYGLVYLYIFEGVFEPINLISHSFSDIINNMQEQGEG